MADDISVLGISVETKGVKEGSAALDKLAVSGKNAEKSTGELTNTSKKASNEISSLAKASLSAGAAFAAWRSIKSIAAEMLEVQQAAQKMRTSLEYSAGGAKGAAQELAYLRSVTNKLGLDFTSAGAAYAKFAASTKGTGVSLEQTKNVFEGIAAASAQLGLSSDETQGALLALSQMASKGTVAAEELRGQLGERLPGAFNIAAKAMGVTTGELGKMLEQGQVMANDFLPKFGQALKDNFQAPLSSLTQEVNRFTSAWTLWKQELSNGTNGNSFKWLTDGLNESSASMKNLGDNAGVVYKLLMAIGGFSGGSLGFFKNDTKLLQESEIAKLGNLKTQIKELEEQEKKYGSLPPITSDRLKSLREEANNTRKSLMDLAVVRGKESGFKAPDLAGDYAAQQDKINQSLKAYSSDTSNAPRAAKVAAEVDKENKAFNTAVSGLLETDKRYQDALKAHNDRLKEIQKDPKAESTANSIANATLTADLDRIKKESDSVLSIYASSSRTVEALHSASLIDDQTYYESKASFIRLNAEAQESAFKKEIERLQQEKASGKDRIENEQKIADAHASIAKIRDEAASASIINNIQAEASIKKLAEGYDNARASAEAYLASVSRRSARELSGMGMGDAYRADQQEKNRIEDTFISTRSTLDSDLRRNQITKQQYDEYLAIAKNTYDEEMRIHADSRDKIEEKNKTWLTGASDALANYANESKKVAKQTEDAFTNAFKGLEDVFVNFVKTGKVDFSSLAESMIADLARIQFKSAMAPITSGIGDWLKSAFSGFHTGGIVGSEPTFSRNVSPSVFAGAPRFHTGGIAGDEVPIIARRGEGVFTEGQMKAMGGSSVIVNVVNNADGTKATQTQREDSSGTRIIDVLIEQVDAALAGNVSRGYGKLPSAMESRYGLNRAAGAY